ncbi:hypothetical protein AbraIFM66950_002476, partial [Aspergillus brasiliensis]
NQTRLEDCRKTSPTPQDGNADCPEPEGLETVKPHEEWVRAAKGFATVQQTYHDRTSGAPQSSREATNGSNASLWREVIQKEIDLLTKKKCWGLARKMDMP